MPWWWGSGPFFTLGLFFPNSLPIVCSFESHIHFWVDCVYPPASFQALQKSSIKCSSLVEHPDSNLQWTELKASSISTSYPGIWENFASVSYGPFLTLLKPLWWNFWKDVDNQFVQIRRLLILMVSKNLTHIEKEGGMRLWITKWTLIWTISNICVCIAKCIFMSSLYTWDWPMLSVCIQMIASLECK